MELDHSYSPDLEIDADNRVVAARDIQKHEVISVPGHMFAKIIGASGFSDAWTFHLPYDSWSVVLARKPRG